MRKKIILIALAVLLLAAVLFVPIPGETYEDGGTREYTALTYKVVKWNRLIEGDIYEATKVYWVPDNFKSIDELWEQEAPETENKFIATVLDIHNSVALVQPMDGEEVLRSSDQVQFGIEELEDIGAEIGSVVTVYYSGGIMETYPAKIHAVKWEITKDLRHMAYEDVWLDKETAEKYEDNNAFEHIVITEIYSNCFFAQTVIPMPYTIKLNGTLSEEWCVGDQVICTYENTYYDGENNRMEVDFLTVEPSDWQPEPFVAYKPVIYLYPEEETDVNVSLALKGKLTCAYPKYSGGWKVSAAPDGMLKDEKGQTYNYLYWEGQMDVSWDMEEGFCIKGEDTAAFLEDALEKLGLNRKEANEFIVYWLPLMEKNPYNIISFQTECYTDAAKLEVTPSPDTVIRVFMAFQASDSMIRILPQVLTAPERSGFTVVEWGGTEIK